MEVNALGIAAEGSLGKSWTEGLRAIMYRCRLAGEVARLSSWATVAEVAGLKVKWLGPEILLVAVSGMHKGFL
jgi:hypothetical protein